MLGLLLIVVPLVSEASLASSSNYDAFIAYPISSILQFLPMTHFVNSFRHTCIRSCSKGCSLSGMNTSFPLRISLSPNKVIWRSGRRGLIAILLVMLLVGIAVGLVVGQLGPSIHTPGYGLIFGLVFGSMGGLIFGLAFGLVGGRTGFAAFFTALCAPLFPLAARFVTVGSRGLS